MNLDEEEEVSVAKGTDVSSMQNRRIKMKNRLKQIFNIWKLEETNTDI